MSQYPFVFESIIERFAVGKTKKIWYNVLFLPEHLQTQLPFDKYPRLRVEGEIADIPIANAFMPTGDGRYYVIVKPDIFKSADVVLGDEVEMRFCIADQDHVDVPNALHKAVYADSKMQQKWEVLTPGKQRMLAQHVFSAKTEPTTHKRVKEAMEALADFGADLRAWRRGRK